MMRVPEDSVLVGKTLADSRLVSAAGMIVIALERRNKVDDAAFAHYRSQVGDKTAGAGAPGAFEELRHWSELVIEREAPVLQGLVCRADPPGRSHGAENSTLVKGLLHHTDFAAASMQRARHPAQRPHTQSKPGLRAPEGGRSSVASGGEVAFRRCRHAGIRRIRAVNEEDLREVYRLQERCSSCACRGTRALGGETAGPQPARRCIRLPAARHFPQA